MLQNYIKQCENYIIRYERLENKDDALMLIEIYDKLCGYIFFLRKELGELESRSINAEATFKAEMIKKVSTLRSESQTPVMSQIERQAEFDTLEFMMARFSSEADFKRLKNVVLGIEKTIDAIDHRINWIKHEQKMKV